MSLKEGRLSWENNNRSLNKNPKEPDQLFFIYIKYKKCLITGIFIDLYAEGLERI